MNVSAAIRTDEHGPEESCGAAAWEDMVLETDGAGYKDRSLTPFVWA